MRPLRSAGSVLCRFSSRVGWLQPHYCVPSSPVLHAEERFCDLLSCHGHGFNPLVRYSLTTLPWFANEYNDLEGMWGRQPYMGMCSHAANEENSVAGNGVEVQRLYKDMKEAMDKKCMPYAGQLRALLQQCSSPADVKLAMDATARLRCLKAVQGQQKANFSIHMSQLMVEACLRSGDPNSGLQTLLKLNPYGFTPCIDQAHMLLKYAKEHKNVKLMQRILRTMVANDVRPTSGTADIVLRMCKESGDAELVLKLAKEFHVNGIEFHGSLFDIIISCAANAGDASQVYGVQEWREQQGLAHTTASSFSLAKAFVLDGKPHEAAELLRDHCTDTALRDKYLTIMVKVWPLQVTAKLDEDSKETNLGELKEKTLAMFNVLGDLGCTVPIDVSEDFATGMGSISKAQQEVVSATPTVQEDLSAGPSSQEDAAAIPTS